jgi:hypothetical protein
MATANIFQILNLVYGAKGIPFPNKPLQGNGTAIAKVGEYSRPAIADKSTTGSLIRKFDDELLGTYQFLPASIRWKNSNGADQTTDLPNALVIISGEKNIQETDIVDVGTVFEKVFTRPYDITIICTLIGENGNWPETNLIEFRDIWKEDMVVTLKCGLTNLFIEPENNFLIKRMDILDNQGSENVEVIQFSGMSNIEFELIFNGSN